MDVNVVSDVPLFWKQVHFEKVDVVGGVCPECAAKMLMPMSVLPLVFCPKCGNYYKMSFECLYCHGLFNQLSVEGLCPSCEHRDFIFGRN